MASRAQSDAHAENPMAWATFAGIMLFPERLVQQVGRCSSVASFGLFADRPGAAMLAILFAALNAIAQISWITVNPTWTLILIALDVIVIYQLSARSQPSP
jgi:hypothetical protein